VNVSKSLNRIFILLYFMSITGVAILRRHVYDSSMKTGAPSRFSRTLLLTAAFLFFVASALAAGETFPKPAGAVNDFAGVIPAQYAGPMENLAREVLEKTGTAIVVATVKTVGDNDPNDYANRLYQAWGIGKKGEDKGILIFLAVKERRVRIETGYGVEGILPDGLAGEILDRHAIPAFKAGDYGKGFSDTLAAVSAVVAKAAGATLTGAQPPPQQQRQVRTEKGIGIGQILLLILAAFFLLGTRQGRAMLPWLLLLLMSGGSGRRGGDGFGGFGGGGFGGFGGGSSGGGGADRGF
jgi:uncharacterized protein